MFTSSDSCALSLSSNKDPGNHKIPPLTGETNEIGSLSPFSLLSSHLQYHCPQIPRHQLNPHLNQSCLNLNQNWTPHPSYFCWPLKGEKVQDTLLICVRHAKCNFQGNYLSTDGLSNSSLAPSLFGSFLSALCQWHPVRDEQRSRRHLSWGQSEHRVASWGEKEQLLVTACRTCWNHQEKDSRPSWRLSFLSQSSSSCVAVWLSADAAGDQTPMN